MAKPSRSDLVLRTLFDVASAGTGVGALLARGLGGNGPSSVGADGTPAESYPNPLHTVNVNWIPGPPQLNAMLKAGVADKAAQMQSLKQHNDTLLKYVRQLPANATPKQVHLAMMQGVADEEALDEYWDDKKPRKDYSPSSSAVKAIRITPDNRIEVMWGSTPRWYTYKQHATPYEASLAAKKLLTCGSIGRALIRKSKKPGIGDWGRAQYDGAMAKA